MELTEVRCPCGAAHDIPTGLLNELRTERPELDPENMRVACPECARKLVRAMLPDLAAEILVRAVKEGRNNAVSDQEKTEIDFDENEHETDDGVLFVFDNLLKWLPKSQIEFDRDDKTITLPVWLATKEGLI